MNRKTAVIIIALLAILAIALVYMIINSGYFNVIHDIAITDVMVSTTQLHPGETLNITVTARNNGTASETFNVTSYCNNTSIGMQTVNNLAPNAEGSLIFTWSTADAPIANYVIKVEAEPVPNETDTTNNIYVAEVIHIRQESTGKETLYIEPSAIEKVAGQTFAVNINVSYAADLYGWEVKLGWNATILEAVNVFEGSFLKNGGTTFLTNNMNNTEGSVKMDCTLLRETPGVSGNGTLVTLRFRVIEAGNCELSFLSSTLVDSLEQTIAHTTVGASFSGTHGIE